MVIGARPNTLADAVDIVTGFDEYISHSWEVHRKKEVATPPMEFKKILSIFNVSLKPPYRSFGKTRPPPSQSQSQVHGMYQPPQQFHRLVETGCTFYGKEHLGEMQKKDRGMLGCDQTGHFIRECHYHGVR